MDKKSLIWSGISGALAVAAGALGAHALRPVLDSEQMHAYSTAALYHLVHSVVLLCLAVAGNTYPSRWLRWAGVFIQWGILLFCGSLYLLAVKTVTGWEFLRFLGPVTPLGGLAFMAGWISIAMVMIRGNR